MDVHQRSMSRLVVRMVQELLQDDSRINWEDRMDAIRKKLENGGERLELCGWQLVSNSHVPKNKLKFTFQTVVKTVFPR